MNDLLIKITAYIKLYKWLLLLLIPFVIFLFFLISLFLFTPSSPRGTTTSPSVTAIPTRIPDIYSGENLEHEIEPLENRSDFQNKEIRTDGTTVYTFASANPQRPNMLVSTPDKLVFSREISLKEAPPAPISVSIKVFGQPDKIVQGSKFYGKEANIYVYSSTGLAFIGNPQTDEIFEVQHFQPMSTDEYIKLFGDQN